MKKVIKTTHIDTGGHGYLSVSKKDFLLVGCSPKGITGYSGHNLTRMYLEEDCDQSYFFLIANNRGFEVERKSGYNLKFNITHGYKPELFNYVPEVGDILNDSKYEITTVDERGIFIRDIKTGNGYRIGLNNPFQYIENVVKSKDLVKI